MVTRVLRLSEVIEITGLSKSAIYAEAAAENFPKPIKLTKRSSGWLEEEVIDWKQQKIAERDGKAA